MGDSSLSTLLHFRYLSRIKAGAGGGGKGNNMHGKNGRDRLERVPFGTEVWAVDEGRGRRLLADILSEEPIVVARGGSGGKGNARFVTPTNQEPVLSEGGERGERVPLVLELKLLADVGIVGKPNAGKSTLLGSCTRANPKVADYPFTTIEPVLGVVGVGDDSFVMLDIPGVVEGAHKGVGLGHEFLQHMQRTRLLIYLLDGSSLAPARDFEEVAEELRLFDPTLIEKLHIIAVNKIDVPEVGEGTAKVRGELEALGKPLQFISAATGEGVDALMTSAAGVLRHIPILRPDPEPISMQWGGKAVSPLAVEALRVEKGNEGYVVHCPAVERLIAGANLGDWRVVVQLRRQLERLGVDSELERQGVRPGDTVYIGGVELEWV